MGEALLYLQTEQSGNFCGRRPPPLCRCERKAQQGRSLSGLGQAGAEAVCGFLSQEAGLPSTAPGFPAGFQVQALIHDAFTGLLLVFQSRSPL